MTESKNLSKARWENYQFLWLLISFSGRTKQIFFLLIKLEPPILPWLQPRKNNCVPTELDVSISAFVLCLVAIIDLFQCDPWCLPTQKWLKSATNDISIQEFRKILCPSQNIWTLLVSIDSGPMCITDSFQNKYLACFNPK